MSIKLSERQLQDWLPELLDQVAKNGEPYVVQRDGKDFAVLVSARQWRQRTIAQQLDELGEDYHLSSAKQARVEELLATRKDRSLTATERRELKTLLQECDEILLRRAAALEKLP